MASDAVEVAPARAQVVESDPTGCVVLGELSRALHGLPPEVRVAVSSSVDDTGFGLDVRIDEGRGPVRAVRIPMVRTQCATVARAVADVVDDELWRSAAARDLVDVRDDERCIDVVAVAEDLVERLGPGRTRRAEGRVDVVELEGALLLTMHARPLDDPDPPWEDDESIVVSDCPTAAKLVADSIYLGVTGGRPPPPQLLPPPSSVAGAGGAGVGDHVEPRLALALSWDAGDGALVAYARVRTALSGMAMPAFDRRSAAAWMELQTGGGLRYGAPGHPLTARVELLAGPGVAVGLGYPDATPAVYAAVCGGPGLDARITRAWTLQVDVAFAPTYELQVENQDPRRTAVMRTEMGVAWRP